jgi:hypothetical protein
MKPYEFIQEYEKVLKIFGQWPSFHDGEVHRVVLDRTRQFESGWYYPSVELLIRGWTMTSEVTEAGNYKLKHDSLVHLLFEQVYDLELAGLNHQNVLSSLELELLNEAQPEGPILSVELSYCFGLFGNFKTRKASVISVKPYVVGALSS